METDTELVGAGEGSGGGLATDLSAKHRPNKPATTSAKHVPRALFIASATLASFIPQKQDRCQTIRPPGVTY
jgi:hypothetical protein